MKFHLKIPGGGEFRFERKSGDDDTLLNLALLLLMLLPFWAVWALR